MCDMKIYHFNSLTCGDEDRIEAVTAYCHEQAVDVLIESRVREYFGIYEGFLDEKSILSDPSCTGLQDHLGKTASLILVSEIKAPNRPGPISYYNRRAVSIDVVASLVRRRAI